MHTCSADETLIVFPEGETDFCAGQHFIRTGRVKVIVALMTKQTNFRELLRKR